MLCRGLLIATTVKEKEKETEEKEKKNGVRVDVVRRVLWGRRLKKSEEACAVKKEGKKHRGFCACYCVHPVWLS